MRAIGDNVINTWLILNPSILLGLIFWKNRKKSNNNNNSGFMHCLWWQFFFLNFSDHRLRLLIFQVKRSVILINWCHIAARWAGFTNRQSTGIFTHHDHLQGSQKMVAKTQKIWAAVLINAIKSLLASRTHSTSSLKHNTCAATCLTRSVFFGGFHSKVFLHWLRCSPLGNHCKHHQHRFMLLSLSELISHSEHLLP